MSDVPAADQPQSVPRPAKRRRSATFRLLAAAAALTAAGFGVRYALHARSYESTDDAFLEGHVIPCSARVSGHVLRVPVADNQWVNKGDLLAELDPRDFELKLEQARARLRVTQARQLAAVRTTELTRVTSGAGVDEASSAWARSLSGVEVARAQVEAARSRGDQAAAQRAVAEAGAEQVRAEGAAAEAEAGRAEADWKRYQEAQTSRGVSRQQLDLASAAAAVARARVEALHKKEAAALAQIREARAAERVAGQNLSQADAQLGEALARVGEAKSRLAGAKGAPHQLGASQSQAHAVRAEQELAQAAVRQAELELSYTRVLAPEAGRVTRRSVEAGAFVQTGQALLAVVPRDFWVVANFKETQLPRVKPGNTVQVRIDAYPGHLFRGHVDSLQAGAGARFSVLPPENATGNFVKVVQRIPVKIVFDEALPPELSLGPGMSVEPEVRIR